MRRTYRTRIAGYLALLASSLALACGPAPQSKIKVPGREGAFKSVAIGRAERRAYDGAPPVIAHEDFGIECVSCHNADGMAIDNLGFAPPSPHEKTTGLGSDSRCVQCHVFALTDHLFVANGFRGLQQDLRRGHRLNPISPPTIPHKTFMREDCSACHTGPAAREEIRTSHPDRIRCRQCHVPRKTDQLF